MIIWIVVAVVGIAAGFATPMFLMGDGEPKPEKEQEVQSQKLPIPDPDDDIGFVEFEEQVVNFNDPRFSRYLKISFSLQVAKSQVEAVTALVEEKNASKVQIACAEKSTTRSTKYFLLTESSEFRTSFIKN